MASSQNAEEAANIVSEFMSSLDNIPHEVQFLLQEIRLKDIRSQEINEEITKDQAKYIKHALRDSGSPRSPTIVSSRTISLLPAKITAAYATLDELCVEKIAIAEELQALLNRTKLRLDMEAAKVRALNGTADEPKLSAPVTLKRYATTPVLQEGYAQTRQLTELRNALTADLAGNEPANKRRRVTASSTPLRASPTLTGPIPLTIPSLPYGYATNNTQRARSSTPRTSSARTANSRSRLRQSHTSGLADDDLDAEGEDDPDADAEADPDEEEDLTLYCVCKKTSYGDMIGCDNPDCPYQWFHISCVGVETPLPDKWYCAECTQKGHAIFPTAPANTGERKRGRK